LVCIFYFVSKKNLKVEQGKATRDRLVELAFRIFSENGYAATALDGLIKEAGLTKGALYHHFKSKLDLFEAVYIRAEEEVATRINNASAGATDPWDQLLEGCDAYLEACADPGLQRILRLDGPSVLGWERWSQIDAEFGSGKLEIFLEILNQSEVIDVSSTRALSHLLSGALNEATFWIAQAQDSNEALDQSRKVLRKMLNGIRKSGNNISA
jgi:AcrR family transcriptional regulator